MFLYVPIISYDFSCFLGHPENVSGWMEPFLVASCSKTEYRSPETIHIQCSRGAHPRPPRPPHLRWGAADPPHPPLMSASGLPTYQGFHKILIEEPINGERRPTLREGVWGGAAPPT